MTMTPRLSATVLLLALMHTPAIPAQRIAADGAQQTFTVLSDQFFSEVYFKFSPTNGTSAGLHQYDSQLEDYSAAEVEREAAALHDYEKKVQAIDPSALDAPQAADREILLNNIRSQLLSLEIIRGWEKDPDNYSSGITSSAFVIMERPYASADTRLRALVEREKKMLELMQMAGLRMPAFILSWMLTYVVITAVVTLVISLMLSLGGVFPRSDFSVIFLLLFVFGLALISFAFMLAPFFSRAKVAGAVGALVNVLLSVIFVPLAAIGGTTPGTPPIQKLPTRTKHTPTFYYI